MEKVTKTKQNNMISDEKSFESSACATSKEHMHEGHEENKKNDDRKEMEKEKEWLQPKKGVSMKHVCETCRRKETKNENNNKYEAFSDDEGKEVDE